MDNACAQVALGGGFQFGVPIVTGKQVFARTGSLGISAVLSYSPPRSRVFPSVTYLIKTIHVPVASAEYNTLDGIARYRNYALNLNYRTTEDDHYSLFFLGIGIANIQPQTGLNDNHGNPLTLVDTGNINIYPLVQAGIKHMHRILPNGNFYLCLEADVKYVRMYSGNQYSIQQGANFTKATINGNIIFPGVQVQLIYVFQRRGELY